jgi:hypothetical protein
MMDNYNDRYRRFSSRIEKMILVLIAALSLLMIAGELLIEIDPIRSVLVETERWEGISRQP